MLIKNGKENNLLQLFLILLFIISNRSSFAQIVKGLKKKTLQQKFVMGHM